jgi:hypothetical protein
LTHEVNNKSVRELNLPVSVNKTKAVGIYYFIELSEIKGQTLYHERLNNGKAVLIAG